MGKPETFDFLGFTHICSTLGTGGRFAVKRQTAAKRMRSRLAALNEALYVRRNLPIRVQGRWLQQVITGYFQYHAVPGNSRRLSQFRYAVTLHWRRALSRRSQRGKMTWTRLQPLLARWIPLPRILHDWPAKRFDAMTRGKSRMR